MELNEKDLELIAKIDERLKHYKLITDNEQADKEEYVECINNHGFEDHLIFENIYKVIGKDDEYYELIIKGLQSGFYVKKRFKPSTKEAYLKQFLPDNEQQAPAEITAAKGTLLYKHCWELNTYNHKVWIRFRTSCPSNPRNP